jgi:hypothetical protein
LTFCGVHLTRDRVADDGGFQTAITHPPTCSRAGRRLPAFTARLGVLQPAGATVCLEPAAQGGHEKEADMRRTQLITTAAFVAACAVPATAAAQGQDLRSPDTRDAAAAAQEQSYQDLRSPDARDAASQPEPRQYSDLRSPDARDAATASTQTAYQDLRSPDARDVGREPVTVQIPEPVVQIHEVPGSGFDWGDAGIGAAGLLALLSITGGVTLMALGRRRRRGSEVPAH